MLPPALVTEVEAFWVRVPVDLTKIGEALLTVMPLNAMSPPLSVTDPVDVIAPLTPIK